MTRLRWNLMVTGFRFVCPTVALGQCWLAAWQYQAAMRMGAPAFLVGLNASCMVVNVICAAVNMQTGWRGWVYFRLAPKP